MAYSLFDVYGVEMEYMIVDRTSLSVQPVADQLLKRMAGSWVSDFENGPIDWSNELVNHVVEIKTHRPEPSLAGPGAALPCQCGRKLTSNWRPSVPCCCLQGLTP
jgi:hypothetical protein